MSSNQTSVPRDDDAVASDLSFTINSSNASVVIVTQTANDSTTAFDEMYPDFTQIPAVFYLFIVLYFLVMVLALSGNFMVCYVVFSNRKMHTVVNYYIVNLAVCDFMVGAFVLPVKLIEMAAPAEWGALNDPVCTAMAYLQTIFVFASVLTLVATCLERYVAILHPLESRMYQSKKRAKRILLIIWFIPCTAALPFVIFKSVALVDKLSSEYGTIHRISCYTDFPETFRVGYYTCLFVFFYLIPLTFIGGTCFRIARCLVRGISFQRQGSVRRQEANRRKVAKMIMVVVMAFTVFWTPYFLVTMITQFSTDNYFEKHNFFFTMMVINIFGFINSCVNPFIYAAMSSRFRCGFKRFLRIITCSLQPGIKHAISKRNNPRSGVDHFSRKYNRHIFVYSNDCGRNNSEGSGSRSDSGSINQSMAVVHDDSVRSLRSLVSCLSLKKTTSSNGNSISNSVCVGGIGKYVFSELVTIPGSPVDGATATEKRFKKFGIAKDNESRETFNNDGSLAEESFITGHIPQGANEEVWSQDQLEKSDTLGDNRAKIVRSNDTTLFSHPTQKTKDLRETFDEVFEDNFDDKAYLINNYASTRDSVILMSNSVALMPVNHFQNCIRRHSLEKAIHILEIRSFSNKKVLRSASAPSSLL